MLRYICRETDMGAACNVGGPVDVEYCTFTDPVRLEEWLRFVGIEHYKYTSRTVIGVEVVQEDADND